MTAKVTRRPPQSDSPSTTPPRPALATWHDDVDRLFDSFFPAAFGRSLQGLDPWLGHPFQGFGDLVPSVDVKECADRYEIAAELPGLDVKDVDISVRDGVLHIRGEKKVEKNEEKEAVRISERSYGTFERSFVLPDDADAEAIGAEFAKGVLTVTVRKHDEPVERDKKIEIKPH